MCFINTRCEKQVDVCAHVRAVMVIMILRSACIITCNCMIVKILADFPEIFIYTDSRVHRQRAGRKIDRKVGKTGTRFVEGISSDVQDNNTIFVYKKLCFVTPKLLCSFHSHQERKRDACICSLNMRKNSSRDFVAMKVCSEAIIII